MIRIRQRKRPGHASPPPDSAVPPESHRRALIDRARAAGLDLFGGRMGAPILEVGLCHAAVTWEQAEALVREAEQGGDELRRSIEAPVRKRFDDYLAGAEIDQVLRQETGNIRHASVSSDEC